MPEIIKSRKWTLVKQVGDNIDLDKTFKLGTSDIDPSSLKDNEFLARTLYLSNDPAQRTWISGDIPEDRHYMKVVQLGTL